MIDPKSIRSILVYGHRELIGDGILKLPFIQALKNQFPDARLTWATFFKDTVYKTVLSSFVHNQIDEILSGTYWGQTWRQALNSPLPHRHFDLIIETTARLPEVFVLRKLSHRHFLSRAWNWRFSDIKPPHFRQKSPHLAQQLMDYVRVATGQPDLPLPEVSLTIPADIKKQARTLTPAKNFVILAPGAGQKQKCWPLGRYIELGKALLDQGICPLYLLGPGEINWRDSLRQQVPEACYPLEKMLDAPSPLLTVALGQRASSIVHNDSGGGHILALAHRPMISLFGPTPSEKFKPLTREGVTLSAAQYNSLNIGDIPVQDVLDKVLRYH